MKCRAILVTMALLILMSGCKGKNNKKSEIKFLDKAPNSLDDTYKSIGEILDNTGKIEKMNLDIYVEENNNEISSGKTSTKESNNKKVDGGEGNDGKAEDDSKEMDAKKNEDQEDKTWKKIDKSLEELYLKWSTYENEAVKKGASKTKILDFQESINRLAKSVEEKDIVGIYDFGSKALLNLKPLYDLYKDDYLGEVCKIKYITYQYYILAMTGDKDAALDVIKSKEESINRIRLLMDNNKKKLKELEKVSGLLENLGISLEEDSKRVYILEKDTLVKNIKSME